MTPFDPFSQIQLNIETNNKEHDPLAPRYEKKVILINFSSDEKLSWIYIFVNFMGHIYIHDSTKLIHGKFDIEYGELFF